MTLFYAPWIPPMPLWSARSTVGGQVASGLVNLELGDDDPSGNTTYAGGLWTVTRAGLFEAWFTGSMAVATGVTEESSFRYQVNGSPIGVGVIQQGDNSVTIRMLERLAIGDTLGIFWTILLQTPTLGTCEAWVQRLGR